jgi:hypothetical protein
MEKNLDSLFLFLEKLPSLKVLKPATTNSWLSTLKIFSKLLEEEEKKDLTKVDTQLWVERFKKINEDQQHTGRHQKEYQEQTLKIYKCRIDTVLNEFSRFLLDKSAYIPQTKSSIVPGRPKNVLAKNQNQFNNAEIEVKKLMNVPILLRSGLIVNVVNIPIDFTRAEFDKIKSILEHYVNI